MLVSELLGRKANIYCAHYPLGYVADELQHCSYVSYALSYDSSSPALYHWTICCSISLLITL